MGKIIDKLKLINKELGKQSLSFEVLKGLKDPITGLPKDWAGNVMDRAYFENQIERVRSKIPNETEKEEKKRLIMELDYWKKRLIEFDKEHEIHNNSRDSDGSR